jgi:Domain of unknown function (DUF5655)
MSHSNDFLGALFRGGVVRSCEKRGRDGPERRHNGAMPVRTWAEMRESITSALIRDTGHDVAWWNERIAAEPAIADEGALRGWLNTEGVTGYKQMLLVMERFGYPDFLLASADDLLDGQYADRPQLRPILDAVVAAACTFGPVDVQARKTYTSLLTPRRTFAAVKATTRTRVDLVLRLDGARPGGRLLDGRNSAGGGLNVRLALQSVADLDAEALDLLQRAYEASA